MEFFHLVLCTSLSLFDLLQCGQLLINVVPVSDLGVADGATVNELAFLLDEVSSLSFQLLNLFAELLHLIVVDLVIRLLLFILLSNNVGHLSIFVDLNLPVILWALGVVELVHVGILVLFGPPLLLLLIITAGLLLLLGFISTIFTLSSIIVIATTSASAIAATSTTSFLFLFFVSLSLRAFFTLLNIYLLLHI